MIDLPTIVSILFGGLYTGSIYGMLAVSLTIIFGIAKTINLSHGEILTMGAYTTFWLFVYFKIEPLISSLLLVPCLFAGLGFLTYIFGGFSKVLSRSTTRSERESSTLIITFGLILIITNGIAGIYSPDIKAYTYLTKTLDIGEIHFALNKIIVPFVMIFLVVGLLLMMKKTWFGKSFSYVLEDDVVAELVGVEANKVYLYCFMIGFVIAGIAGSVYSFSYGIYPYMGLKFTMAAFVAVIFGGIGSVVGALVGGLFLGIATSVISYFTSPLLDISVIYFILIIVLLIRPRGLFRR